MSVACASKGACEKRGEKVRIGCLPFDPGAKSSRARLERGHGTEGGARRGAEHAGSTHMAEFQSKIKFGLRAWVRV